MEELKELLKEMTGELLCLRVQLDQIDDTIRFVEDLGEDIKDIIQEADEEEE